MAGRWWGPLHKAAGWSLVILAAAPVYRLLDGASGVAAEQFVLIGAAYGGSSLIALGLVVLLGLVLSPWASGVGSSVTGAVSVLEGPRLAAVSGAAGLVASAAFSLLALDAGPFLVDGMSQLLQARLFAGGSTVLPADVPVEFWYFQYLAPATSGWTSQYPPGFAVLLALGLLVGLPWLVGPVVHGLTAWLGVRLAQRLFPHERRLVLIAATLLALSPFTVALAGSMMNHGLAALLGVVAVYAAVRAGRGGEFVWGLLAGGVVGIAATVRPLSAAVLGAVAVLAWILSRPGGARWSRGWRFPVGGTLAALPASVALLWYNTRLFGDPLTFGYEAAQGPGHGLGFHRDPWGASYGPVEALAFTATELRALGAELAGVPLPLTLLIGLALALASGVGRRHRLLMAWALTPVVAGLFYWHHDLSMGPRLLADVAPAWVLLFAWAAAKAMDWLTAVRGGRHVRLAHGLALAAVAAALVASPLRLFDYRSAALERGLLVDERPGRSALVFVHDTWESRLAARLAAAGLRDDEIREALAAYSTCQLQTLLDAADLRSGVRPASLRRPPARAAGLITRTMPSGSAVRTLPGEELTSRCQREAASDFTGIAGLPQRAWRGDLPGVERGRTLYARDMGPERNEELMALYPSREPWLLVPADPGGRARLEPYHEGMDRLWSDGLGPP